MISIVKVLPCVLVVVLFGRVLVFFWGLFLIGFVVLLGW